MKKLLLGVTGSVAAIKMLELVNKLQKNFTIKIVITQKAHYFIQDQLAAAIEAGIFVYNDEDEWVALDQDYPVGLPILHIELRRWADIVLIAPLDAHTLAKVAYGFCDNLLTSVIRAWDWQKPLLACPAMNTLMWENPPTAQQIALLESYGATIIGPISKRLACNDIGVGAMAEVDEIVKIMQLYTSLP